MAVSIKNGNELIIQGGLEAGFSLYTGYPGSPLADYFNILFHQKAEFKKKGIKVVIANSEANAAAMASGAKQAGRDTLLAMKSMGLHVASDALSVGNFADPGPKNEKGESPGVVVAVGDDPWSISTSTAADSRYLFKHLHIPFLEPSTPQELKDWIKVALKISQKSSIYQGLLLTTFMAEGGGRVELYEEAKVDQALVELDPAKFDLQKNVMVPPNSLVADVSMITKRFPRVYQALAEADLDQLFGNKNSRIGFISSGATFETLKQYLEESGALSDVSLYKLACSYPLIENKLLPFLKGLDHLIVVEEKRGFLENELYEFISKFGLKLSVHGKQFGTKEGFPAYGGLSYEIIAQKCDQLFVGLNLNSHCLHSKTPTELGLTLPRRLPTFCPGCPHRETLSLLKELRSDLAKKGIKLISHGDVGCYSLSFLPPFKEMHNLSAMGQGGALGAGVDMFTTNPSVVLMGDSTFYHSGITDISNSVQMGHNITYILLDNDNTAMTGHQVTPSSGISVDGEKRPHQDILKAVQALGVDYATEVNPSDRYFYKNLLTDVVHKKGVKIIVSNKECGLTFHGRKKSEERKLFQEDKTLSVQSFYQINTDVCEDCRACVDMTGCPGLTLKEDAYGTKVTIDSQICVSDSYCTKIKACPSFERVDVFDYHPSKYIQIEEQKESNLSLAKPTIKKSLDDIANGGVWRAVVTGVGGSGVTTISKVLSLAAQDMDSRNDLDFKFVDQKGLAQRNGNVTGHMSIFKKGTSQGPVSPIAGADCLLSPDLLDGSTHIKYLSESGLLILDEDFQVPLSIMLDQVNPLKKDDLIKELKNKFGDRLKLYPLKRKSSEAFGKSVYASAMILGVAFQLGVLPFGEENLKDAFKKAMKKGEFETNWKAFVIGRELVSTNAHQSDKDIDQVTSEQLLQSLEESSLLGRKVLSVRFNQYLDQLSSLFGEFNRNHLAQFVHDILLFDRGSEWNRFIDAAKTIKDSSSPADVKWRALRVVARTFWIKDEVFVAHKMISSIQKKRDQEKYSKLGSHFKVVHINRPSFDVFGKKIEFDINPKKWQLRLMRHCRFLRGVLPSWHKQEREIAQRIRREIVRLIQLNDTQALNKIIELENIKGYREVRYDKASKVWGN